MSMTGSKSLQGDELFDEISEGLATSSLVSSAIIVGKAVRGQYLSGTQMRSFLVDAGIGATTAALLDALLLPLTN